MCDICVLSLNGHYSIMVGWRSRLYTCMCAELPGLRKMICVPWRQVTLHMCEIQKHSIQMYKYKSLGFATTQVVEDSSCHGTQLSCSLSHAPQLFILGRVVESKLSRMFFTSALTRSRLLFLKEKKKTGCTGFGQPMRLIACARCRCHITLYPILTL